MMYFKRAWSGRFALLVCLAFSLNAPAQEFRALWVDAFNSGFKTASQVSQLVADARAGNFNAVIIQARKRGDAYYNSNFEPKAADISSGFDPLADLIAKAHDTNTGPRIEVHAWIVTYNIWNNRTNQPSQAGHPFRLHPDWLTQQETSTNSWDGSNYAFDPAHPGVQEHTFNVALDIISRYDVDGLNFDYIRYDGNEWGYNPVAVARFNSQFNRAGPPSRTDPDWLQFRRDQVSALVRKIYLHSAALKPQVKISADTICFAPGVTTASGFISSSAAYNSVLQDWRGWMKEGILDIAIPMAYFDLGGQYAYSWTNWNTFAKNHRYNRHAVIGPGIYLNSLSNALVQMRYTRQPTAQGNFADGVCGYSYNAPTSGGAASRSTFLAALTQTNTSRLYETNLTPIFATPATPPVMPWKTAPTRGHLKGFVRQATNSIPFDGTSVTLNGPTNRTLVTDATGFYGAVDLPPGSYAVQATAFGYAPATSNVLITEGQVSTADFHLTPAAPTPPSFVVQPQSVIADVGQSVTFSAVAEGAQPLGFRWRRNGVTIPGATSSNYTIASVVASNAATYTVILSNAYQQVISTNAVLTVTPFENVTVYAGAGAAAITWRTASAGSTRVEYGPTPAYGLSTPLDARPVIQHAALLTGLTPGATYFYRAVSVMGGSELRSAGGSFTTGGDSIVDNPQASLSGSWQTGTSSTDKFGADYRFVSTTNGSPTATATFRPLIAVPARYDVFTWYPEGGNRSANTPYTVVHRDGSVLVRVNQTDNGGGWRLLAADLPFNAGTGGHVIVANNAADTGKVVMADAVRFAYRLEQDVPPAGSVPSWWSLAYFGADSANGATDHDGDGYSTADEYLLGTAPNDAGSRLMFQITPGNGGQWQALLAPFLAGRSYVLEERPSLTAPGWTPMVTPPPSASGNGLGVIPIGTPGAPQSILRLRVSWGP